MASALIKLKELPHLPGSSHLYSALIREKSLLKVRVEKLIEPMREKEPRFGWGHRRVRIFISVWIVMAVMTATLGGNQRSYRPPNPAWVNQLLKSIGIET